MAEPSSHHDSVALTTSLFGIKMSGANAITMMLFIMLLGIAGLQLWEARDRFAEHRDVVCNTRLALYIYTTPKGEPIDWQRMPTDLYHCIPKFLYDRPVAR